MAIDIASFQPHLPPVLRSLASPRHLRDQRPFTGRSDGFGRTPNDRLDVRGGGQVTRLHGTATFTA
jgi:hypothetical protein